jgi:2-polyprenyl-6-methoxyphenol hydroxylase-like FAD-dependent oxidoreductase
MAGQPDAIALGSGPAGLLAAAALDRQGFDVLILDQDQPPTADDEGRDGVPHGAQLHNILGRGQHISTSCFPAMWTPW